MKGSTIALIGGGTVAVIILGSMMMKDKPTKKVRPPYPPLPPQGPPAADTISDLKAKKAIFEALCPEVSLEAAQADVIVLQADVLNAFKAGEDVVVKISYEGPDPDEVVIGMCREDQSLILPGWMKARVFVKTSRSLYSMMPRIKHIVEARFSGLITQLLPHYGPNGWIRLGGKSDGPESTVRLG